MASNGISTTKIYTGVILPYINKIDETKYAVYIPEIHGGTTQDRKTNYIWAANEYSNNYQVLRNLDGSSTEFGNYFPLEKELGVQIKFRTLDANSAYIIGASQEHNANPKGPGSIERDDYYLVCGTKNKSKIYIDDTKNRIHMTQQNGKMDFIMDDYGIAMQTNDISTANNIMLSRMELSQNGFYVQFGDNKLTFNETGFGITQGEHRTFLKMTKKGIEIVGEDFINISTTGKLNIYGESTYLTGEGSLNLRGTNTKLSGLQKLAMNGNIIHMEGFMDTHIKAGLSLNLDSKLHMSTSAIIMDQQYYGMSNIFTAMENKVTSLSSETSTFKSEAISTIASDGMSLKGIGIGASTSGAVASSTTATMIGLKASMFGMTSAFNLDNIGMSIASAIITDNAIADTAEPASHVQDNLFGTIANSNSRNYLTKLNDLTRSTEAKSNKYVVPNSILTNYK